MTVAIEDAPFMRVLSGTAHLNVQVIGTNGVPVVLLHGLGGSSRSWLELPSHLERARRVILPDLRGCGASERGTETYSFALLGLDAVAVLDALAIERCHLVGHSLGGVVAQELLTVHGGRVCSAVLVSTSSRVGEAASAGWLRLADVVEKRGFESAEAAAARGFSPEFARAQPDVVREVGRAAVASDRRVYAEQARVASGYDYTDALAAVRQPVLVVQGLADQLTSAAGSVILSRTLPNAELQMIEGAGHNLHLELGARFVEIVESFFRRAEATA